MTMKRLLVAFVATFALWLTACHAAPAAPGAQAADTRAPIPASAASARSAVGTSSATDPDLVLDGKLSKGMAYNELRKIVIDHGWQPQPDAQCMANVVGGNYKKLCSEHPELGSCRACIDVRELSSCSGDGHCLMQFSHEGFGKTLQVGTYGEIGDWNAPAGKSTLSVTGWEYRSPAAQ
jgi:hypothetical protein